MKEAAISFSSTRRVSISTIAIDIRTIRPLRFGSRLWKPSESIDPSATGREKLVNTYDNGIRFQVDEFFRVFVSETTNQNYVILYTSDHGQTLAEHGQVYTHMKPDKVIVDVPEFLVSGERYGKAGLLAGIPPGIRVSHLNNFATLLDLMGVPMSLRVRPYDKSIFSLTPRTTGCVTI